jgi:cyclopropane-fatty-acyl-phospholipid synthase
VSSLSPVAVRQQRAADDTLALIQEVLGPPDSWGIAVRLWDGTRLGPSAPRTTVVLVHPWSLRSLLWPLTEINAGDAYIFGDVDVEGGIEDIFDLLDDLADLEWRRPAVFIRFARHLLALPAPPSGRDPSRAAVTTGALHSRSRDRAAVRHHYDVSNDFYAKWLDPRMQYSCGYFRSPDDSLDDAQEAKVDYICRKLRLREGDRLLDIGCGWGGLLEHAALDYGVSGLGVTLSEPQAEHANDRLRRAGVADRVRVEVRDYRETEGTFDKIVSVGMIEHVGEDMLRPYFAQALRLLKPGGVFLNHGITTTWDGRGPLGRRSFVGRYVFPDAELQPISIVLGAAETEGFEVRDVESLREHYTRTLRHWVSNLEAAHDEVVQETDEVTYRIWRLYMAGSAHNFDAGRLSVFQALLHRPSGGPACLPQTREDWYADPVGQRTFARDVHPDAGALEGESVLSRG